MALHDPRDLVVSLPCDVSKLLAVSEHTEEVEMTHVPVETPSVNPLSQGFTTLAGINLVSLDVGMANQVGQAAFLYLYQPRYHGFVSVPPPLLLNSGLVGMRAPGFLWLHSHSLV